MTIWKSIVRVNFYILVCFASSTSCSKKSEPTPSPTGTTTTPAVTCQMTKSTITFSGGSSRVYEFRYDGNGFLTGWTDTYSNPGSAPDVTAYTYSYASGVIASVTAVSGGVTTVASWTNDTNHRVTKIATTTNPSTETAFTYDVDGNFKSCVITQGPGTTTIAAQYANTQLQTFTVNSASPGFSLNGTYTYSAYDLKNNPWSLLATATGQRFFTNTITGSVNPEHLFKSNPGKDEYDQVDPGGSSHQTDIYTYEYNAKNYPTKITRQQAGVLSPVVTTFEYSNCN